MIDKIFRPSIIFLSGILIIIIVFVFFIQLHMAAVNRIEEIHVDMENINHLIYESMADDSMDETKIADLESLIQKLLDNDSFNALLGTFHDFKTDAFTIEIENKQDLYDTYLFIENINGKIHLFSIQREKSFRILYLLITITVIIMILFLGISQYENFKVLRSEQIRNEINNKLYDQLEKERSLIAFELHDDIAQKLAIIKRYFQSKNSIDEHTILMEKYSSDVIRRVRYLSRMLKAPDNPDVSFKDYLETLFSDFNVLSEFKLNRKTVGLNALRLKPSAALHIYRIIQEILTNSRIHSEATEIDLLLVYSHPTLNIKYSDNGKGFDPYLVYRKGIGLDSIKYRLDILRGEYNLKSNEGEGTDISIDIPIELCEIS